MVLQRVSSGRQATLQIDQKRHLPSACRNVPRWVACQFRAAHERGERDARIGIRHRWWKRKCQSHKQKCRPARRRGKPSSSARACLRHPSDPGRRDRSRSLRRPRGEPRRSRPRGRSVKEDATNGKERKGQRVVRESGRAGGKTGRTSLSYWAEQRVLTSRLMTGGSSE